VPHRLIASLLGFSVAAFGGAVFCAVHPLKVARAHERVVTAIVPEPAAKGRLEAPSEPAAVEAPRQASPADDAPALHPITRRHRDNSGNWVTYEQIPRSLARPVSYDAYRYPVRAGVAGGRHSVISGYDLDLPDAEQRRGSFLNMVGHGGVDLPQAKGEPIRLVALDHQVGPATVVYIGEMFGTTVVTKHSRREAGKIVDYLVIFGHMSAVAPGLKPGARLEDGDLVGGVGNTGSPLLIHLHLEMRRVRDGVDPRRHDGWHLLPVSIACDPRNLLPLK
jgi:murein DD-endopeptidase MepM/ murein hydrolase activator NlpD